MKLTGMEGIYITLSYSCDWRLRVSALKKSSTLAAIVQSRTRTRSFLGELYPGEIIFVRQASVRIAREQVRTCVVLPLENRKVLVTRTGHRLNLQLLHETMGDDLGGQWERNHEDGVGESSCRSRIEIVSCSNDLGHTFVGDDIF